MITNNCYICNSTIGARVYKAYDQCLCSETCQSKLVKNNIYDHNSRIVMKRTYNTLALNNSYKECKKLNYISDESSYYDKLNCYNFNAYSMLYPAKFLDLLKFIPIIAARSIQSIIHVISK